MNRGFCFILQVFNFKCTEKEEEEEDVTDSEDSVFSGLEDSLSDSADDDDDDDDDEDQKVEPEQTPQVKVRVCGERQLCLVETYLFSSPFPGTSPVFCSTCRREQRRKMSTNRTLQMRR